MNSFKKKSEFLIVRLTPREKYELTKRAALYKPLSNLSDYIRFALGLGKKELENTTADILHPDVQDQKV